MDSTRRSNLNIPKRTMSPKVAKRLASRKFYQLIMRWHFFCGLLFIPLIIVISISGAIYLFEDEYEEFVYEDLLFVSPGVETLPVSTLLAKAQLVLPGMRASYVRVSREENRSAEIIFRSKEGGGEAGHAHHAQPEKTAKISMEWAGDGAESVPVVMNQKKASVYVNPYTGGILGTVDNDDRLMGFMKDLHGNLLAGKFGTKFVELTSCWLMVLMITGLIIWWPRGKMGLMGTLIPRLNTNKRLFWRDLHAVPAFYFSFFIIFLVISGLPWTDIWGGGFKEIQSGLKMSAPAGFRSRAIKSEFVADGTQISIDQVISEAHKNGIQGDLNIKVPRDKNDTFAVQSVSDDPAESPSMHVDQYSGKVLAVSDWGKVPLLAKAVPYGIKLHRGEYFGVWNLVLVLITTLVLILMAVSGMVMWLQRRPKDRLGEFKAPKDYRKPYWVIGTTVALSIFMPLVGASLALFILGDFIYQRVCLFRDKRNSLTQLGASSSA